MRYLRILTICLFSFLLSVSHADAKDFIAPMNYTISLYNHGYESSIQKSDAFLLKARITHLLKDSTADTSEPWYKFEKEKHGLSLKEQWDIIKEGSYFSLQYDEEQYEAVMENDRFIPQEIIVEIKDTSKDGFFGEVMAYDANKDHVKAYQIEHKNLVSLYCFEKTIPYLPEHYNMLVEKYNTAEYFDSGISCNSYMDSLLRMQAERKRKKADKWRKLRAQKYGVTETEDETEDETQ